LVDDGSSSNRHHRPVRRLLLILAATLTACGGVGRVATRPEPVPVPHERSRAAADAAVVRMLGSGREFVAIAEAPALGIHVEPGTQRPYMDLNALNPWGQRLRLSVIRGGTDATGEVWLRVRLPIWPNGQAGWVDASEVRLLPARERIVVDLSSRTLTRFHGSTRVVRFAVGVGSASTPTPPGRYFVWAKVATGRPSGPYGSFILGLSGFSDAIEPWNEWPGEPRLAIHGTDDPGDAGHAVSKGCIRVPDALLRQLRDVPMGTPVVIRR
jgi:lipoprotein-anchoring transpeptidase ErfK/SrfK